MPVLEGLGIQLRTGKNMPIQNGHPIYTMSKAACVSLTRPEELEGHDQEGHSELAKRSRTLHGVNSHLHVPLENVCRTTVSLLERERVFDGHYSSRLSITDKTRRP